MKKLLIMLLIVAAIGGLIFAFIEGRAEFARERERESPVKAPTRITVIGGENVVKIDEAERKQGGVEVGPLPALAHQATIRAFGVVVDPQELIDLRGQIETALAQLNKARAASEVAGKEFQRQKSLVKSQNVSEKSFQDAEGNFLVEQANVAVAQAQVNAMEATARQRWGAIIGQAIIDNAASAERLRRKEDLLLHITFPNGVALAEAPMTATVQGADGSALAAKFISPAQRTDAKIQGRSFFYMAEAKDAGLLPGMNVAALLPVGESQPGALVPGSAIVWLHGKAWAYVERESDHFARREISTEQPHDDGFFQLADFAKGERFVVKGAQVLLSEEFRAQILIGEEAEGK